MANSTDALPYAVVVAAALALFIPPSFAWFTPGMYAPGLGFLMFAVGVNLRPEAFKQVFMSPKTILVGNVCQWIVKPLLGLILALTLVPVLGLPHAVGTGIILVSCVSGAQLSNYATFLVHPEQAPLSIVLTALSTAAGVFMTPVLALLLLGARIPVDARGMALSITQIVLVPVLAGLTCSTYFPAFVARARPFLTFASVLDTCACVGASLASNSATARSAMGLAVLLPVAVLHILAYYLGYRMARATVASNDVPLARCISLESGMQSSLLGLLLASRFFRDPLVSLPCGISTIFMTLSGFGLVVWWKRRAAPASDGTTPAAW
ncbi:g1380 [Coccomyxa viridis]|uniref:G1380 protein n=1 Tax=Coccomyxa viridis TaxID=1274662 RepID=A0ABP1FHV7_9CHLO